MSKQTFTTGQVLTAAQVNSLQSNDFNQTVSVKTAAYTLVAADKGTRIEFNTSGSVTVTVNTGLFDAGDTLVIQNRGAGAVTVTAGTATVNTSATLVLSQYDAGTLYFISASAAIFFNTDAGGGSPLTTKGDLYGFSTLDARIPIGANATVLTADSNETLGLKWATPSGGLTLISRSTFTGVTSVSLTGVISASYDAYLISVEKLYYTGGGSRDLLVTLLYSSSTEQTTDYYFNTVKLGASNTNTSGSAASSWNFCTQQSSNTNQAGHFLAYLTMVNNLGSPQFSGHGLGGDSFTATLAAGLNTTSRSYTGIKLTSSSGSNFHGTVAIYGLGI